MPLTKQRLHIDGLQLAQCIRNRTPKELRHLLRVTVCATERLAHDAIDEAEGLQPVRGDTECLGRIGRLLRTFPKNGRAPSGEITE